MDKDRIDMALEIGLIVEKEDHITVVETQETIRMAIIMVIEATDAEIGITKQIIDIMTGPVTDEKVLTKIMVKEIETEV